jgi:RNA polymerase sigma factor (sigma-70 family)
MQELDPKERRILELRFGLKGNRTHTLKEIGKIVGLSRERVRQIEMEAIERLRAFLASGVRNAGLRVSP